MHEDRKPVIGENDMQEWCETGLEYTSVGIWRAGDGYTHDTKVRIASNVARYRPDMTEWMEGGVFMGKGLCINSKTREEGPIMLGGRTCSSLVN